MRNPVLKQQQKDNEEADMGGRKRGRGGGREISYSSSLRPKKISGLIGIDQREK